MEKLAAQLQKRALPPVLPAHPASGSMTAEEWKTRKEELTALLARELYGVTPAEYRNLPIRAEADAQMPVDLEHTCAGKAETRRYHLVLSLPDGTEYKIPFVFHLPKKEGKLPVILHIAFREDYPDIYLPVEEIIDRGYALLQFCYQNAAPDRMHGDFSGGLAAHFIGNPRRSDEWGDIGIWAYTATRFMDWIGTQESLDASCVSVTGHSRLGKTALWCGAQDERFFCTYCNDGGYAGSGLIRGKIGEDIEDFFRCGSWSWFCENFKAYRNRPYEELPYDMHFLVAAAAPRYVYIASAETDGCMDYTSDFLSAAAASEVWEALGHPGLVTEDRLPVPGETVLHEGRIGYHVRRGTHYLSREDWGHFMDFLDRKREESGK